MKYVFYIILFGVIGLAVGYFLFAKFGGHYIPVFDLFMKQKGLLDKVGDAVTGANEIRQNIYICGGVGAAAGLLLAALGGGKKR